jgi:hypothetical protein
VRQTLSSDRFVVRYLASRIERVSALVGQLGRAQRPASRTLGN